MHSCFKWLIDTDTKARRLWQASGGLKQTTFELEGLRNQHMR